MLLSKKFIRNRRLQWHPIMTQTKRIRDAPDLTFLKYVRAEFSRICIIKGPGRISFIQLGFNLKKKNSSTSVDN